jgi:hypothetical protein
VPTFAKKIWSSVSVTILVIAMVAAVSVHAATITSGNDFPTTLQAGEDANHTVIFTTPSGIDEGETITISFDADFDTSALTEDDVDVEDDGADLTSAADCTGAEEASIAIAADTVTVTICAGDGGAIAAASEVTIEIGTNAEDSGVGAGQVTNPPLVGTYYLSIAGTFGDTGSMAIPIGENDSVNVTADVDQVGGGGGGGGGGCGDSTAPVISSVTASGITESAATITWSTGESADSKVDYGLTGSYEIGTETDTSLVTGHSVSLSGLSEGTTYHFRVRSADLCANEATSGDFTFTTLDVTACVNSNVEAVDIGETTARIIWDTDESATSIVDYGLSDSYGTTASDGTLTTDHSVILAGLSEATTYHYRVRCEDPSGNEGASGDFTFTTEEDAPPSNVSDLTATPGDTSCDLTWSNPPDEDLAGVLALICTDDYPSDPDDPDCSETFDGLAEAFTDTGLTNDTTYYYGLFAYDEAGQFASGALESCTPSAPEEELPPEEVPEEAPPEEEAPEGGAAVICGDGYCDATESSLTCPADCPAEEVPEEEVPPEEEAPPAEEEEIPPTTVPEGELIPSNDVSFLVEGGAIELTVDEDGEMDVLTDSELRVELVLENVVKEIDHVTLIFGSDMYVMSAEDGVYAANIITAGEIGQETVAVTIFYTDGTAQSLTFFANLVGPGYTYELLDGEESRVGGSTMTLFFGGEVWDGSPYGQLNPTTTNSKGEFSWYVENGSYSVRAAKDGYDEAEVTLMVMNNIVNPKIRLSPITPIAEIIPEIVPEPIAESIAAVAETVGEALETIRAVPGVEESATIAAPIVATAALASAVVLAAAFDLIPLLQYLFTAPILFFWRRRRKGFGVVYHAYTKVPIDLAIVRLYRLPENKLVRSRVTDKGGRYFFLVQPGEYRITATKPDFIFPSVHLASVKDDGQYLDVYHGEVIRVADRDVTITPNIPMDPLAPESAQTPKRVLRMKRLRFVQHTVAIIGLVLAAYVFVIRPSWWTFALATVQVVVYLFARRLAKPRKPKSWGIVYDRSTGRPLEKAVVRVFEPKYHKLLETNVTDSKGRYTFLLGPSEYYTTYEKSGYETVEIKPIDYSKKTEATELSMDVHLSPKGEAPSQPKPSNEPK